MDEYADYRVEAPPERVGDTQKLVKLAQDLVAAEDLIASLETQLAEAKATRRGLAEHDIPDLMSDMELDSYKTTTGVEIGLQEVVNAHISKERADEAHEWIEETGNGNLIKRQFVIEFGRGDEAWARKFAGDLKKRKRKLNHVVKRAVHPQTLGKFVRDRLRDGKEVEMTLLGVHQKKVARVTVAGQ